MRSHKYSFELKNDLSELKTLCQNLNKFGLATGLSEAHIMDINICSDELFTNIVLYGFEDDIEHIIRFTISLDNNVLSLTIEDDGVAFNPLEKKDAEIPSDLGEIKIGGFGIHIVKRLMDDILYTRERGKNRVVLIKNL